VYVGLEKQEWQSIVFEREWLMIVLMFGIDTGMSDKELIKILTQQKEQLAKEVGDAVETAICEQCGWSMYDVYCEILIPISK